MGVHRRAADTAAIVAAHLVAAAAVGGRGREHLGLGAVGGQHVARRALQLWRGVLRARG